jgi:prevent-host-death family protein
MDIKKVLPLTEARKNIFKIIEAVERESSCYGLTDRGKIKAVIMSAEEFESWRETLEVLKDFPDLDESIAEAKKDLKNKNFITLDQLLVSQGYVLAEKPKTDYASAVSRPKGAKKSVKTKRGRKG